MKKFFEISQLDQVPKKLCGVYSLFDKNKKLIYIGKSTNISNRLKTHHRLNFKNFRNQFCYFNFTPISDEITALLVESKEIKENKPLFNKKLRRLKNLKLFSNIL
ncbi:MAG: nucleotide excision repair endonuclease [Limisphaerales bacterium]